MTDPALNLRRLAEAARLHQDGRLDAAEKEYAALLAETPDDPIALINGGTLALARNDVVTAVARLTRAVGRVPNNPIALGNLAMALIHAGRNDESLAMAERALRVQPTGAQLLNTRGIALARLGRHREAIAMFEQALSREPHYLEAALNLGDVHNRLGDGVAARAAFERALCLAPDHVTARNGHAFATALTGALDEAAVALDALSRARPDDAEVWQTRAAVANWAWQHEQAEQSFRRAAALSPESDPARFGIASTLLARGEYARGFASFEARREGIGDVRTRLPQFRAWDGAAFDGTLLVYGEQGLGDVVQFARFMPQARSRVGRTVLLLDDYWKPLAPLLGTLQGVDRIVTDASQLADERVAFRASVLSLPHLLESSVATLPQPPYLRAPDDRVEPWAQRLAALARPRIGLAWSVLARDDHAYVTLHKSVPPSALAELVNLPDVSFVSLQPGEAGNPASLGGARDRVHDFRSNLRDFGDTAALIDNVDLVISADTAVAHVAGALGKPLYLLDRYNSCWRWRLDAATSPWYPTARIFRQPRFGDWLSVGNAVTRALQEWLAQRTAS